MLIRPDVLEAMTSQNRKRQMGRSASAASIITPIQANTAPKVSKEESFERHKRMRAAELSKNMVTSNAA